MSAPGRWGGVGEAPKPGNSAAQTPGHRPTPPPPPPPPPPSEATELVRDHLCGSVKIWTAIVRHERKRARRQFVHRCNAGPRQLSVFERTTNFTTQIGEEPPSPQGPQLRTIQTQV